MGKARHPFCPSQHLLEGNQRAAGDGGWSGGLWQKLPYCSAARRAALARRQSAGECKTVLLHTKSGVVYKPRGGEGALQGGGQGGCRGVGGEGAPRNGWPGYHPGHPSSCHGSCSGVCELNSCRSYSFNQSLRYSNGHSIQHVGILTCHCKAIGNCCESVTDSPRIC